MSRVFQVIGTQRSGTNLLRLILNKLGVSAPHPPHILKTFMPILSSYRDLNNQDCFRKLVHDVISWIDSNPVTWNCQFKVDEVMDRCKSNSLISVLEAVYEIKMEADGMRLWCNKSTFNVHYFDLIESIQPVYIHLYRDGRDVALSFRYTPVGPKHVYFVAKQWLADQRAAIDIKNKVAKHRYVALKYEDLILNPEETLTYLCNQLNIEYRPEALEFYNSQESIKTARAGKMWENLKKPILPDNFGKYLFQMTSNEIDIFESVAGNMLQKLGYSVKMNGIHNKNIYQSDFEDIDHQMRQEVLKNIEARERKKRSKRSELLNTFGYR
ncbi:MAG: sulfotransferase [Fulvivirga sp.]|nr:sulfotransferase [Fulvivirga sp.]